MNRALVALALVIASLPLAAVEESHAVQRLDQRGYDFYDFSWSLMGWSVVNTKGSYDFYDRTGRFTGWAQCLTPDLIEYFDASGVCYRRVVVDVQGTELATSPEGTIFTIGVPNHHDGSDAYDANGRIVHESTQVTYREFGIRQPTDPDER